MREEELKLADKNAECEKMTRKYSSLCHQLNVLDTFYNSVNPMIDRLRSEIKNIGNTGNPGISSTLPRGNQAKSVNQARYRLRKALGLNQDESLETFLEAF